MEQELNDIGCSKRFQVNKNKIFGCKQRMFKQRKYDKLSTHKMKLKAMFLMGYSGGNLIEVLDIIQLNVGKKLEMIGIAFKET